MSMRDPPASVGMSQQTKGYLRHFHGVIPPGLNRTCGDYRPFGCLSDRGVPTWKYFSSLLRRP